MHLRLSGSPIERINGHPVFPLCDAVDREEGLRQNSN